MYVCVLQQHADILCVTFVLPFHQEIRFFKADGKIKFLLETASAAVSGKPASGGQLIIISQEEIQAYATANM